MLVHSGSKDVAGKRGAIGLLVVAIILGACGADVPSSSPQPSASLEVKPTASPSAEPAAAVSPSASLGRFPVRESAEADALFRRADTCTNSTIGYRVTFPDEWYTNTAIGEQAACTWFTPDFFEVDAPGEMPEEVWISIALIESIVGYNMLTPAESGGEVEVDGYAAHWTEYRNLEDIDDSDSTDLAYHYVIPLDRAGPTLVAATDNHMAADYELAKAVLDRMMASMELDPVIARVPTIPEEPTGPVIRGDPINSEDADESFRLMLDADQDRYRAGQQIDVMATLTYLGPADAVTARGSSHPGLIGFAVDKEESPIAVAPAFTTDCGVHEMVRGAAVDYPFAKSGGYSPDEPLAPFYEAYFESEELRLPAGTWTISAAGSWYTGDDCGDELHSLSASVTVVVEP